jgi:hypothetical protein
MKLLQRLLKLPTLADVDGANARQKRPQTFKKNI